MSVIMPVIMSAMLLLVAALTPNFLQDSPGNHIAGAAGEARFIEPGVRSVQLDMQLTLGGHIFIEGQIGRSRPLWFILDSGAMNTVVSARAANELSLQSSAVGTVTGSGEHSEQIRLVDHLALSIPEIEFRRDRVPAIPLESLEASFGRPIDGILGYDFVSQFVVEIEYARKLVRFYDPKTYHYDGPGKEFPIKWSDGQPAIDVTVQVPGKSPATALFQLDTGAGSTIEFFSPYVAAAKMLDSIGRKVELDGRGVGGDSRSFYTRIASMSVGDYTVRNPVAALSGAQAGSMASDAAAGLIGGGFFRRFMLIFDQSRGRVIFEPSQTLDSPDLYDGIGARILAEGPDLKSFTVFQLVKDSPAFHQGLRVGDVITRVDGVPSSKMSIDELRARLLQGQPGLSLTINREGKQVVVKIIPRQII